MTSEPTMTVVVPATNDPPTLDRCVEAIRSGSVPPDELVVVTDPAGTGPAMARNQGGRDAKGDVLVFVDADVLVHRDALARIREAFAEDASITALFGSYDEEPEAPGAVSGFRNLLHHYVHQSAAGEARTFWAGLGAVRRDVFLAAGGFDAEHYPEPSIEDIELGARLHAAGALIVLDPEIRGTHLKRWSMAEVLRTDFARRGVPWAELVARGGASSDVLNLGWRHRLSAAASVIAVAAFARRRLAPATAAVALMLWLNRGFYALLLRRRGVREAAAGFGLHIVHHLTSVAALVVGLTRSLSAGQKSHQRS